MKRSYKIIISSVVGIVLAGLLVWWASQANFQVLSPSGTIAERQKSLIVFTVLLSLIVVIPVFALLFGIAWRYREGNAKRAKYRPDWDYNKPAEILWWGLPCAIIVVLSVIIWTTSHELDPYKAIASDKKPVAVQVVSLQWRWLFIYPKEKIAIVNEVRFPEKTPLNMTLTSDAPMNSLWIPKLGSQVYTMNGMSTKLHLMANETGDFPGSTTNISGKGYAKMKFTAKSVSENDYKSWVEKTRRQSQPLDWQKYQELAKPTEDTNVHTFKLADVDLYDKIINKYMSHDEAKPHGSSEPMHDMGGM